MALPLVYAINSAFKPLDEIFVYPPKFFVIHPTMDNFQDLFVIMGKSWVPFSRYIFNNCVYNVSRHGRPLIIASMAAYVLAKYSFSRKQILFQSYLWLRLCFQDMFWYTQLPCNDKVTLGRYLFICYCAGFCNADGTFPL